MGGGIYNGVVSFIAAIVGAIDAYTYGGAASGSVTGPVVVAT